MLVLAIIIGAIVGIVVGINLPVIPYALSSYFAISIIAAMDSVFGAIVAIINSKFNIKTFISGFFGNAILSILLVLLGKKLNIDIYLGAVVVFVGRMFNNLGIIRRYTVDKITTKDKK